LVKILAAESLRAEQTMASAQYAIAEAPDSIETSSVYQE
jgi:hypothetical protein